MFCCFQITNWPFQIHNEVWNKWEGTEGESFINHKQNRDKIKDTEAQTVKVIGCIIFVFNINYIMFFTWVLRSWDLYVYMKLIQDKFYFSILFCSRGCPLFNKVEDNKSQLMTLLWRFNRRVSRNTEAYWSFWFKIFHFWLECTKPFLFVMADLPLRT